MINVAVCSLCFLFMLWGAPVRAAIVINGTRVVYPEGKKEVTLSLSNQANTSRLIQAWVEDDDGQTGKVPFIILPPVFRVDPGKGQTLRIMFTGDALPRDRESVFRINVLEVTPQPPGKKAGTHNYMQFPVRSRLKLFYRPADLPGAPAAAANVLRWHVLAGNDSIQIECHNPSAFNVSFQDIRLTPEAEAMKNTISGMCPAKGQARFTLAENKRPVQGTLFFTTIDDYGGFHSRQAPYLNH